MSTRRLPSYRHHRPTRQAVVTLNGRDHYLGPWNSKASRAEYDRLIGEWLANGRRLPNSGDDYNLTVTELVAAYWQFAKGYYVKDGQPTGQLPGVKVVLRMIRQAYGHTLACEFSPLSLKSLQEKMIEAGQCRRYINDNCGRIRRMFSWGVSEEMVPVTVHQALTTVASLKRGRTAAREPDPITPVSESDVERTLPHLPQVVRAMVRFQQLTGCRPGEVRIIRPCDVDTTGDVWVYRPASHKTEHHGHDRMICIGPRGQDVLRPYLLRDKMAYCFSPVESQRKHKVEMRARRKTKVQPSQRDRSKRNPKRQAGHCYTKDSYGRAIHRACIKSGVECWSPNQLRHSAATEIRKNYGLEAVQVTLGHASADVSQIYAERDFDLAKRVMREVG